MPEVWNFSSFAFPSSCTIHNHGATFRTCNLQHQSKFASLLLLCTTLFWLSSGSFVVICNLPPRSFRDTILIHFFWLSSLSPSWKEQFYLHISRHHISFILPRRHSNQLLNTNHLQMQIEGLNNGTRKVEGHVHNNGMQAGGCSLKIIQTADGSRKSLTHSQPPGSASCDIATI